MASEDSGDLQYFSAASAMEVLPFLISNFQKTCFTAFLGSRFEHCTVRFFFFVSSLSLVHFAWQFCTLYSRCVYVRIGQNPDLLVPEFPMRSAAEAASRAIRSDGKLLVAKGIATNGARTLLVATGITTRSKKLLGTRASLLVTKGITTRSKDTTCSKKLLVWSWQV